VALPRHEEWHATVEGNPIEWYQFCIDHGFKPLFIELSNMTLQLMCASDMDPRPALLGRWEVLRVKHEVSEPRDDEQVLYWECHVKINGPYRRDLAKKLAHRTSRDLYRGGYRWYVTHRQGTPFDAEALVDNYVRRMANYRGLSVDGHEYEACILDTNPALDENWL
jgi:hypothetical protein